MRKVSAPDESVNQVQAGRRSGERPWLPLDTASKIFLSTMNAVDTKVFRLTCGLDHTVRVEHLQRALELAQADFPLYQVIIRRGLFWYFMEKSTQKARVQREQDVACAQIYQTSHRGLLFRVLYYKNRIHLEVFHALSDGNGALNFFKRLLAYYLILCDAGQDVDLEAIQARMPYIEDMFSNSFADYSAYFAQDAQAAPGSGAGREAADAVEAAAGTGAMETATEAAGTETVGAAAATKAATKGKAASGTDSASAAADPVRLSLSQRLGKLWSKLRESLGQAPTYRVKDARTEDGRLHIIELHYDASQVLAAARNSQVTITSFLTAAFMQAIYDQMPARLQDKPWRLAVSVPVNLRPYYPSLTSRNFFTVITLAHTFNPGESMSLEALSQVLTQQLKAKTKKDALAPRLEALTQLERNLLVRLVPLYIKDAVLWLANLIRRRNLTANMTNLGVFRLPEELAAQAGHVEEMVVLTASEIPQFSAITYQDNLAVTFASSLDSDAIARRFVELLAAEADLQPSWFVCSKNDSQTTVQVSEQLAVSAEDAGVEVSGVSGVSGTSGTSGAVKTAKVVVGADQAEEKSGDTAAANVQAEFAAEQASLGSQFEQSDEVEPLDETDKTAQHEETEAASSAPTKTIPTSVRQTPYPEVKPRANYNLLPILLGIASALVFLAGYLLSTQLGWPITWRSVTVICACLWVVTWSILRNRHNPAWLILLSSFWIMLGTVLVDWGQGWQGWSLVWGLPIISLGALLATQITMLVAPLYLARGALFASTTALISLLPLIIVYFTNLQPRWPAITSAVCGICFLLGFSILKRRQLKEEIERKFFF